MNDTPPPQTPYELAVTILTGALADHHSLEAAAAIVMSHETRLLAAHVQSLALATLECADRLAGAARAFGAREATAEPEPDTVDAKFTANDDGTYKRCEDLRRDGMQCDRVEEHTGWHLNGIFEWDDAGDLVEPDQRRRFTQCRSIEQTTGLRCELERGHILPAHAQAGRAWTDLEQV